MKMIARGGTPDCKEIIVVMSGHEYPLEKLPSLDHPVIFDVGGHIGSFSLFAFQYYLKHDLKLFVFEPDPENFRYLQKNIQLNAIPEKNISLYQSALSDHEGTGKLDTSKSNDAYTLSEEPKGSFTICPVRTLPAVAKEAGIHTIDILKLDIEGGEYRMLRHEPTFEFLKDHVRFIFMEHHFLDSENNVDWILSRMQGHFDILAPCTTWSQQSMGDILLFKNLKIMS